MANVVEIDTRDITVTPVFKYIEVENVPKSEVAGHAVMETREVVEVRFAGSKNYAPVFPANAFWRREGNRTITYAERWADQYRQFKEGSPQEAMGTPLEMLRAHGVTPELISLCRALRIYSVEALNHLEGPAVKTLGMNANKLKDAARSFMASRASAVGTLAEVDALRAEVARLSKLVPVEEPAPEQVDEIVEAADNEFFAGMTDEQLKEEIAKLAGHKPRGQPSRSTLESMLSELLENNS
jgi:hypothetical protein